MQRRTIFAVLGALLIAAIVSVTTGSHSIANPVVLGSNTNFNVATASSLAVSGDVSGPRELTGEALRV